MNKEQLLSLIAQGEGVSIEFKECKNEVASEVYPTVCSFSNRFGGHLFMGVQDDGTIIGINPKCVKEMKKNFYNMLNNPQKISPTLYLNAEEYNIDNKIILYVYVPRSSQVHTCNKITYDRVGDADIDISRSTTQMSEMFMRKQTDFTEKKIYPYLNISDLNMSLMKRVRNLVKSKDSNHPWIEMDDMDILKSAGLYDKDFSTGEEGFNLAAVLLFGKDTTIRSCLPAYKTDAIFRLNNHDRYDDREEVKTNLIDSFDILTDFIKRHTDEKFFIEGTQRISIRSRIAREIVSNILMHREYSSPFPAKLIIEYGKLMTENANKTYHYGQIKAQSFTPYPKNPIIANFFNNIGRADELGSGVRNLYKYTKIYSDTEPLFFEDDIFKSLIPLYNADKMVISADKAKENGDKKAINGDNMAIENIKHKEIINFVIENGFITNSQGCALLDLRPSAVRKIFEKMVTLGLLVPIGVNRSRKYILPK